MNNDQISMLLAYMIQSQSSNGFVQNFLFPFLLSAISAIIGAYAAYYLLKRSELMAEERRKLDLLNKTSILAMDAFTQMIAIKQDYIKKLSNCDPVIRAFNTPFIKGDFQKIEIPSGLMSLIALSIKEDGNLKWSQPWQFMALRSNYNKTLENWSLRNEIDAECRSMLLVEKATGYFTLDQIYQIVPEKHLVKWIESTELALVMTDDMLILINSLLDQLPEITRKLVSSKALNKYGALDRWNIGEFNTKMLDRVPEADYFNIASLFQMSEAELKYHFRSTISPP